MATTTPEGSDLARLGRTNRCWKVLLTGRTLCRTVQPAHHVDACIRALPVQAALWHRAPTQPHFGTLRKGIPSKGRGTLCR